MTFQGWKGFPPLSFILSPWFYIAAAARPENMSVLHFTVELSNLDCDILWQSKRTRGHHLGTIMHTVVFCLANTMATFSLRIHVYDYCNCICYLRCSLWQQRPSIEGRCDDLTKMRTQRGISKAKYHIISWTTIDLCCIFKTNTTTMPINGIYLFKAHF